MATWKKLLMSGLDLSGTDVTNNHFTVSDSEATPNTTNISLGDTLTFAGGGDISVTESGGTVTISFTEQSAANAFTSFAGDTGTASTPDSTTDTITFEGGSGISTVGGGTDDKITFNLSNIGSLTVLGNTEAGSAAPSAVTIDTDLSSVSADHDTLASAKAIKAAIDAVDVELGLAGDSGTSTVTTSQTLTVQGTTNEIETSVSGQTITVGLPNDVTIAGNLTVSGTTTTVNSETLTVNDHIITVADGSTSAAIAGTAGMEIETADATQLPFIGFNDGSALSEFVVKAEGNTTAFPIQIVQHAAGNPSSGTNVVGVGSLYFNTTDATMHVRIS